MRQPAGAGAALSSYAVNVPVVPHLVDRHEFFVAAGTPASVIGWMQRHRPAGSSQDDSGGGSAGEQWTSFAFRSVHGFAAWPDLVVNAVGARGSRVAVRVDAQVAPRPRLPGTGRGAGDVRVVELGTMLGSSGYELRCGPAGGTVPHPARICAAITRDPALLYSFPGPGHSCPSRAPATRARPARRRSRSPAAGTASRCTRCSRCAPGGRSGRPACGPGCCPARPRSGPFTSARGSGWSASASARRQPSACCAARCARRCRAAGVAALVAALREANARLREATEAKDAQLAAAQAQIGVPWISSKAGTPGLPSCTTCMSPSSSRTNRSSASGSPDMCSAIAQSPVICRVS